MAEMFVGTIHAFCLELLKSEAPNTSNTRSQRGPAGLFVDRHSKQSGLTTSTDLTGLALKRYRDTERYIGALSILREADLDDANLAGLFARRRPGGLSGAPDDSSYLDYSSILEAAVDVLTNDDAICASVLRRASRICDRGRISGR